VQLRGYVDKLQPIDRRLAYQVDKLLLTTQYVRSAAAAAGGADGDDGAAAGGRRQQRGPGKKQGGSDGMQQGEDEEAAARDAEAATAAEQQQQQRDKKAAKKLKARTSNLLKELNEELSAAGPEARAARRRAESAVALAARQRAEARAGVGEGAVGAEGVELSRQGAKRLKAQRRCVLVGLGLCRLIGWLVGGRIGR